MKVTRIIEWDMGHRVPNHKSKCKNVHWHRYKALITMSWDIINEAWSSDEWMVIDFSDLKTIAKWFIDEKLDHWYMYYKEDRIWKMIADQGMKTIEVDFIPTAENIVIWLFEKLDILFKKSELWKNMKLEKIVLYETPNNFVEHNPK